MVEVAVRAGRCAVFPAHALGHIASLQRVRLKCSKSLSYEHPSNLFAQDLARLHYPISHYNISYANDEDTGMGAVNITMERSNEHLQPQHEPEIAFKKNLEKMKGLYS